MKLKEKFNNQSLFGLFLYLTLIIGFLYGENLNFGSYYDWLTVYKPPITDFSLNFKETLLSYDQYGQRHSPIYLIFLSFFLDLGFNFNFIRIIHLHLCLSLVLFFYKCLKLNFENVDKRYLQLLSLVLIMSPTFRSLSIWPDSRLPGLIFFSLSVYYFIKFTKFNSLKYAWFTFFSLIISSYISPNFSVFFFYYSFIFYKKLKLKDLFLICIFTFFASIPALYYMFILEINFMFAGRAPAYDLILSDSIILSKFNFSDKILIISSIILFHLLPILYLKNVRIDFFNYIKNNLIKILVLLLLLIYFFSYRPEFTGGGIFFQFSQMLFDSNYLFFFICFFSISFIMFISQMNISNLFLCTLIIASNIQHSIYHKYYEPMILIIFFTLFKGIDVKLFFKNMRGLVYLYIFSLVYILSRVFKLVYLV